MESLAQKIEKAVYTSTWFNPSELQRGYKETYDIFPDGKIVWRYFKGTSRKMSAKKEWILKPGTVLELFERIVDCMHSATDVTPFVDDSGATLKLSFWGGEIILPRGLGTQGTCIGWIMEPFVSELQKDSE